MKRSTLMAAVLIAMTAVATAQTSGESKTGKGNAALPGGSSSLQESFGDWTVRCAVQENVRTCLMQQQQLHSETKQLALAIELTPGAKSTATGTLILPFGLKLAAGVTVQIDEQPPSGPLSFSTCLPVGCVVPLALDTTAVAALRTGSAVKVTAIANDSGQGVQLSISLKSFPAAHDRLKAIDPK